MRPLGSIAVAADRPTSSSESIALNVQCPLKSRTTRQVAGGFAVVRNQGHPVAVVDHRRIQAGGILESMLSMCHDVPL